MRIPITASDVGVRLDKLLVQKVPGIGRAGAKRLFADGRVRIVSGAGEGRGRRAAKGDVAADGDAIEVELESERPSEGAVPDADAPLHVLLETPHVVVADKPAGQPTAPLDPGERCTSPGSRGENPMPASSGYRARSAFASVPRSPGSSGAVGWPAGLSATTTCGVSSSTWSGALD